MNTETKEIDLAELKMSAGQGKSIMAGSQALPFIGALKVKLTARLGETEISVADLMELKVGSTVALDRVLSHPVDLLAEGHVVAQGTLVAVGEHFGVRITSAPKAA